MAVKITKSKKTVVKTLQAKTYMVVPIRVSSSKRYKYLVQSEYPVDTFILDDEELAKLDDGEEEVTSFDGFNERRMHSVRAKLPCGGKWNLVIANQSSRPTAVYYEI